MAVFLVTEPVFLSYGLPGRADHHHLILLTTLVLFGAVVRLLLEDRRRLPVLGGIAAGFGIWISVEALVAYALATLVLGVAWLREVERPWRMVNLKLHAAAAAVLAAAVMVERPPAQWFSPYLDRPSVVHVALALGLAGFWAAVAPAVRERRTAVKAAAAALSGALVAGVVAAIAPRFFLGPYGDLDPKLVDIWLPRIAEVTPERLTAGRIVMHLGAPLAALAAAPFYLSKRQHGRAARFALLVPLVVTLALGLRQFRWLLYAEAYGAAVLGVVISDVAAALRGSTLQPWVRAPMILWMMVGWVVGGTLLEEPPESVGVARLTQPAPLARRSRRWPTSRQGWWPRTSVSVRRSSSTRRIPSWQLHTSTTRGTAWSYRRWTPRSTARTRGS